MQHKSIKDIKVSKKILKNLVPFFHTCHTLMQTANDSHSESRKSDLTSNTSVPSKNNTQGDSKRWTQFRTSTFPELYTVCE